MALKKKRKKSVGNNKRFTMKIPKWYVVLPFLMAAGIAPILVRGKILELYEKSIIMWSSSNGMIADFFSWQKAIFIILASVAAFVLILLKKYGEGISENSNNKYLIPVLLYSLFVILSTVLSDYPKTSVNGFVDRYEGMGVLAAYVVLFIASIYALDKEERIHTVVWSVVACSLVVLGIGAFQFFEQDLFRTDFGKRMILNNQMYQQKDDLNFTFSPGYIYTTLYNPNYVGSYCAILFPLFTGLLFYEKKILLKLVSVSAMGLAAINIYGCKSTAGLVGLIVALVFVLLMCFVSLFKKHNVIIAIGLVLGLFAFFAFTYVNLTDYNEKGIINDLKLSYIADELWYINDMDISSDKISMNINTGYLEIHNQERVLTFWDDKGEQVTAYQDKSYWKLEDERFKHIRFKVNQDDQILSIYPRSGSHFAVPINETGFHDSISFLGILQPLDKPKFTKFLAGYEKIGSNRGYIWSRSIPLVFKNWFVGSGPDTFAYVFPQNDIAGKMNAGFSSNRVLVDKPHNMYMQIGINTGLISLISIIALFGIYIVSSVKIYWKMRFKNRLNILGLALASGCIGYIVAGLFNDSTVSVAPLFWVLLGCSIAVNNLAIKKVER